MTLQQVKTKKASTSLPSWLTGVLVVIVLAFIAKGLGELFPLVGSILFAILIGVLIRNGIGLQKRFEAGVNFTLKKMLKFSIILLGVSLSFSQVLLIGKQSLLVILIAVLLGIVLAVIFGKLLNINHNISLLIGIGTSICGATAISCAKGVVDSKEEETAYAISTIVLFNLIAFFVYPVVGHLIDLTPTQFGIWAGTAVHDTSSAVAVGYLYGDVSGQTATTVKLVRTLFLLPILMLLPLLTKGQGEKANLKKAFPWFLLGFIALSLFNSFGIVPAELKEWMLIIAKFIIVMVMVAVGLQVNIKQFVLLGVKPLLIGFIASSTVAVVSLLMIIMI